MSKRSARLALNRSKRLSPEEKAALSQGRPCGRISQRQIALLESLGVSSDKTFRWTRYRASKEIEKRLDKGQTPQPRAQSRFPGKRDGRQLQEPDTVASQKAGVTAVACDDDRRLLGPAVAGEKGDRARSSA